MSRNDAERFEALIGRYKRRVFALALYLIGGDQDKTYDVCASGFAEELRESPRWEDEEAFLVALTGRVIKKSRVAKTIPAPTPDVLDLLELPDAEKEPLRVTLKVLQTLDFDAKALVLLRDLCNLSYRQIAVIMRNSESDTRSRINQARVRLRSGIEDALRYA